MVTSPQQRQKDTSTYLVMLVLVALAFCVLLGRLWYIQVIQGDQYFRASTENIIRNVETRPPRGRIFDRNMNVLAENRPSFDVYLIPHLYEKTPEGQRPTLKILQRYLSFSDEEYEQIEDEIARNVGEVLVARDVTRFQVAQIETDRMRLPGISVRAMSHRHYPLNSVGAHLVGFVGEVRPNELSELEPLGYRPGDYIGRMGVEQAFEAVLRGSPGIERSVVDARGIPQGEAETRFLIGEYQKVSPVPGRDIVLTIDAELELAMEKALRDYPAGSAVAVDPRDGSILGMYSKPGFNPNSWSGRLSGQEKLRNDNDPFKPMLDKSVSAYFPGSTFKVAGAAAALELGVMDRDDEVTCRGSYRFGGRRFRCWKRGGHGKMNVVEALQQSCDVYFYKVAEEVGIDAIAKFAYAFGFGESTGFPINNESVGRVPTKEWHRKNSPGGFQHGFALNTVLGQGDTLVTPLQTALTYAAIGNGGDIYYPRIVDRVVRADGTTLFEFEPRRRKKIQISDETMKAVQDGLVAAVAEDGGTAYDDQIESTTVAGKTGTAQVHKIGKIRVANRDKAIHLRDHAWFAAYAPVEEPVIALAVLLEHGGHGGSDGAPTAMKILDHYFSKSAESELERKLGEAGSLRPDDARDEPTSGEEETQAVGDDGE